MRPGRKGPGNPFTKYLRDFFERPGFNEAGAQRPRKPPAPSCWPRLNFPVSMRPGRKGPGNPAAGKTLGSFEAGAFQ